MIYYQNIIMINNKTVIMVFVYETEDLNTGINSLIK